MTTIHFQIDSLTIHVDAKSGIPPVFQTLLEKLMSLPEDLATAAAASAAETKKLNDKVDNFLVVMSTTKDALVAALANVTDPAATAAMTSAIAMLNAATATTVAEEAKVDQAATDLAP